MAQRPKDAFREAREGAQSVSEYLAGEKIEDFGCSRITLVQSRRYAGSESRLEGYLARVAFHVLLSELDRMEEILAGVVDAGANEVSTVELQTSKLKELRVQARRRAVAAAREKAEIYCKAAGMSLGAILHIEDINPDRLGGTGEGHVSRVPHLDDDSTLHAFDPESIMVGAAVAISFAFA
jgi:uncharacterized protein